MRRGFASVALIAATLLALPAPAAATHDFERASYQAWLADPTGSIPRRGSVPVRIWVDRLTSDEDATRLAELVEARGARSLKSALAELEVGRLSIGDRYVVPISYARRFVDDRGEHLILIAQRAISFREVFRGQRTKDYPYTAIQLDLREDGSGSGEVIAAARFLPRADGTIDIDTLQVFSSRLMALRRVEERAGR